VSSRRATNSSHLLVISFMLHLFVLSFCMGSLGPIITLDFEDILASVISNSKRNRDSLDIDILNNYYMDHFLIIYINTVWENMTHRLC